MLASECGAGVRWLSPAVPPRIMDTEGVRADFGFPRAPFQSRPALRGTRLNRKEVRL